MDLGATICTPKIPACTICPLTTSCAARRLGLQGELPRRKAKAGTPLRHGLAFYVTDEQGRVHLRRRPASGLLGGMVELPGTAWTPVATEPPLPDKPADPGLVHAGRVTHTFTHFRLFLDVAVAPRHGFPHQELLDGWFAPAVDLDAEALPTLMRNAVSLARKARDAASPAEGQTASRRRRRS
jgi:A/G-specific adenine glycosylase